MPPAPRNAMPADNRLARAHSDLCGSPRVSSAPCSPASPPFSPHSPHPQAPPPPFATLRRSFSSTFTLIPEERSVSPERQPRRSPLVGLITWYPRKAIAAARVVLSLLCHPAWRQTLVVLPTLWLAAWLWLFWKCAQCPLSAARSLMNAIGTVRRSERRRTVLLSGGSTVQTLHMARNFHSAGARVVVVEVEGLFGLSKFSAAVDRFYTVPRPTPTDPELYIRALCDIAEREGVAHFVPASVTTPAYYDGLAKPRLEKLGCSCFVPGVQEIELLDDTLEMLQRCQGVGLPTPNYTVVSSEADVRTWYQSGGPRAGRHFMASVGARDRIKVVLPEEFRDFRLKREITSTRPWVIVNEVRGDRFLTCTTVKDARVVANVTCGVDSASRALAPRADREIDAWLRRFFEGLPVTGHVTFRLVRDAVTGLILPLGARVGVSPPYLCHASVPPRIRGGCRHLERRLSGIERDWMRTAVARYPGVETVEKLLGTVLDKREALFAYWDPLPYCAYYHFQVPLDYVRAKGRPSSPPASRPTAAA